MPQPTRNPPAPTSTARAFPTFPARHTRTPRPAVAPLPSATPTPAPATLPAAPPTAAATASVDGAPGGQPMAAHVSYTSTPAIVQSALLAQGIHSNVYWFDSGGEPQLMIQYDSPIRNRPGYAEMLEKVKQVAAQHFLRIDPPLYTLWIAATDMTGTSDTVLRLDRYTLERWSRGEIGDADFYNNSFVPARIVITCDAGGCAGVRPTPYPTFPSIPFPFPTPTGIPTLSLPTPTP
ncbi:MAG TPA: hypothetical protein VJ793_01045 [Anaerolineae bacterium]|nr:hypothetical protein [Anaerolineae bacterium]